MEPADQNTPGVWRVPECASAVAYTPEVLEEIRLAALKAFYAFPRGGAEIGGVLFGAQEEALVRITAQRPLDCEHAFGPSFTLSPKDLARLQALLAEAAAEGLQPAGWYHSHTRSEIFLSPQDVAIHQRYFAEPWQVALVVRPGSMVTRAGFFVRAGTGAMRTDASHKEFIIPALGARPMARPTPAMPPPESTAAPMPAPADLEPPPPIVGEPPRPRRFTWRKVLLAAGLACVPLTAIATRERWSGAFPAPAQSTVSLNAYDQDGTLQIRWEWRARAVRRARAGTLEIQDGAVHLFIPLSAERLKTGNCSYQRQSERVEMRLRLEQPDGSRMHESLTFLGKLPAARPAPEQGELERLRTELIREKMLNEGLRRELEKRRPAKPAAKSPKP